jgi:hypothetical protein
MGYLAEIRKKTVETGSHWIVERIYAEGRNQLPVVEGFDQEEVALKRMGELIEEAVGTPFTDSELKRLVRESGFYSQIVKVKLETVDSYCLLYDIR